MYIRTQRTLAVGVSDLVVEKENEQSVKQKIREELKEHGISHVTIETENSVNDCTERECTPQIITASHHHHHH